MSERAESLLRQAAAGDVALLAALRARVAAGEPAAYVAGFLEFEGRRFRSDPRAFITDPETVWLTRAAVEQGRQLARQLGRPPQLLEFGVGAGTLAITLKLAQPAWSVAGIDIDASALELAAENAADHGVDIDLLPGDYLSGWPAQRSPPDLIFGDPPWGDAEDLYEPERDAHYYEQMPPASAFPRSGGRTGIHDELIRRLAGSGWPSWLLLNYGTLPPEVIARSAAPLREWRILNPVPGISLMLGRG